MEHANRKLADNGRRQREIFALDPCSIIQPANRFHHLHFGTQSDSTIGVIGVCSVNAKLPNRSLIRLDERLGAWAIEECALVFQVSKCPVSQIESHQSRLLVRIAILALIP